MAYVFVQEGGASDELYVHVHDTMASAEEGRRSCAGASYRTTGIVVMPDSTDWDAVEDLVGTLNTLDYVDGH